MKSLFENRGQLLETKEVVLKVQNLSDAAEFLKCIDPKSLKSIWIEYRKCHEMDFSELEELEQWKNADINQLTKKSMNQLTVPYEEIENRLAICCEFLLDRKKPIEYAYKSLMEKLGTKLMEYSDFDYWFRRFQNNQFDLAYDTSLDEDTVVGIPSGAQIVNDNRSKTSNVANEVKIDLVDDTSQDCKEISEIWNTVVPVETVERKGNDLKLIHQFNESDVPQIFQTLINRRMKGLRYISLDLNDSFPWLNFDDLDVHFEKKTDNWTVTYNWWATTGNNTIETADPEKSIVDHLWFVLKNPIIKLNNLSIKCNNSEAENHNSQKINSEKLNTFLRSMLNSIDHQFHVKRFECEGYNEDMFLSMLKLTRTLTKISFDISWKAEGNYQKLKEIVETDQWKKAERIFSLGVTPLKVEDLFQYKSVWLEVESVTPKDVLSVTEVDQLAKMANQSTVPHTEVSLRLTILSEFLFDEENSVKELYKSWTRRVGGRIIEFAKFEYWCRRFQKNQFDLGYDTSLDSEGIPEIQNTVVPEASGNKDVSTMTLEVKVVERSMEDLKLDYQFEEENAVFGDPNAMLTVNDNRSETSNVPKEVTIDPGYGTNQESNEISEVQNTMVPEAREDEGSPTKIIETKALVEMVERKPKDLKLNHEFDEKNVPEIFQTLINDRKDDLEFIYLNLNGPHPSLQFDKLHVDLEKNTDNWTVTYTWPSTTEKYKNISTTIETADPEKSLVDHSWFVLKNSNIKPYALTITKKPSFADKYYSHKIDSEKMNTLLKSMLNSIDQFPAGYFSCEGYDEDMFLSMLEHVKSETSYIINFGISWKEEGNYQKMKEIVETNQWKQAKIIYSVGVTPLRIEDLFQYKEFSLEMESITPQDVHRVTEINPLIKMMKQSTVPYEEIENRLAICCEFLLDRKKSIENAYESLMEKLGTKLMEYSEFKYWFKRFQNNQFDLGYDTSLDSKEISEIQNTMNLKAKQVKDVSTMTIDTEAPVRIDERHVGKLKLNHQFNEKDVPQIFKTLINRRMNGLVKISLSLNDSSSSLKFGNLDVRFEKKTDPWAVTYNCYLTKVSATDETADLEKSIVDHLWFVLMNPKIKLNNLTIKRKDSKVNYRKSQEIDSEKVNTLLQSMLSSIGHQFHAKFFKCEGYNEDMFLSMLKHVKPVTLETISFGILRKEKGNYQKMKEIVETDQWKQAKTIDSRGVTTLKIDDLFQCECFSLQLDFITPEVVLSVTEHVFDSTKEKRCSLYSKNQNFDINAIIDFLHAQIDGSKIYERYLQSFTISRPTKLVFLKRKGNSILIQNY